ncbi:4-hydroxy-tetrahydrodipicolinate reductase [Stappia taiwanensis]|nr:4-hydroxy-tetrahydrodipicolinate reductase [Stappia taiwanensis]
MSDMRLAVVGAAGRMGRALIRALHEMDGVCLGGAIERPGVPELGEDAGVLAGVGPLGVPVSDDPLSVIAATEGVLDFTAPAATRHFAELTAQARVVHVIGTTGMSEADLAEIRPAGRHARIVRSGNMSLGVNLLAALVRQAAAALDADFDIEILDAHHRNKVDAPSGTALLLGEAAAEGRGIPLAENELRDRDGITGVRPRGKIGYAALRGGTVIGDHSVMFAGPLETLTLSHHAQDRQIFAHGAVKAALWARDQKPGFYSMADVLGLAD